MGKWYGSINNRIEENRNYELDRKIKVGTDITTYYWSDRHCKYVTKVIDQKHIFVRDWEVCADHSKPGGMGHQDWLYFKTRKEMNQYLNEVYKDDDHMHYDEDPKEPKEEEWAYRYGHWNRVIRFDKALVEEIKKRDGWCRLAPKTDKERLAYDEGKEIVHYQRISEGISFGVRDYYFDWEY